MLPSVLTNDLLVAGGSRPRVFLCGLHARTSGVQVFRGYQHDGIGNVIVGECDENTDLASEL